MDFIPNFSIVIISAVLLVQTDGASTVTTAPSNVTTASTAKSSSPKAVTVVSKVSKKPATKAPISCLSGNCVGDECSNNTVTAAFTNATCTSGVCLTQKTVTKGMASYAFSCAKNDCNTATKSAHTGTTVTCCETKDCNKPLPKENSASRIFNTFTAIMTILLFYILI